MSDMLEESEFSMCVLRILRVPKELETSGLTFPLSILFDLEEDDNWTLVDYFQHRATELYNKILALPSDMTLELSNNRLRLHQSFPLNTKLSTFLESYDHAEKVFNAKLVTIVPKPTLTKRLRGRISLSEPQPGPSSSGSGFLIQPQGQTNDTADTTSVPLSHPMNDLTSPDPERILQEIDRLVTSTSTAAGTSARANKRKACFSTQPSRTTSFKRPPCPPPPKWNHDDAMSVMSNATIVDPEEREAALKSKELFQHRAARYDNCMEIHYTREEFLKNVDGSLIALIRRKLPRISNYLFHHLR